MFVQFSAPRNPHTHKGKQYLNFLASAYSFVLNEQQLRPAPKAGCLVMCKDWARVVMPVSERCRR
jgi:hypothetical protein